VLNNENSFIMTMRALLIVRLLITVTLYSTGKSRDMGMRRTLFSDIF